MYRIAKALAQLGNGTQQANGNTGDTVAARHDGAGDAYSCANNSALHLHDGEFASFYLALSQFYRIVAMLRAGGGLLFGGCRQERCDKQ